MYFLSNTPFQECLAIMHLYYILLVYSIFQNKNAQFYQSVLFLLCSFYFSSYNNLVPLFRSNSLVTLSLCFSWDSLGKRLCRFVLPSFQFRFDCQDTFFFVNSAEPFWELVINVIKDFLHLILLIFSLGWICQ